MSDDTNLSLGDILWEYADYVPPETTEDDAINLPADDTDETSSSETAKNDENTAPPADTASSESEQPSDTGTTQSEKSEETSADTNQAPGDTSPPRQDQDTEETKPPITKTQTGSTPKQGTQTATSRRPSFKKPSIPKEEPIQDKPPAILAEQYRHGLNSLFLRCIASLIIAFVFFFISAASEGPLYVYVTLPPVLESLPFHIGMFTIVIILCMDVAENGFLSLSRKKPNANTLAAFAALFTLIDGVTLFLSNLRDNSLPFFAPCSLILSLHLLGMYCQKYTRMRSCETAATSPRPYLVTQDPNVLAGQSAYRKWNSSPKGFGLQIQKQSQPEILFSRLTPYLMGACILLTFLTTVAHHQPRLVFWGLSASFCGASTLGSGLTVELPLIMLTSKLSALGATLAGWPGISAAKNCPAALLFDYDIYPPGTVSLAKSQTFGTFSASQVLSCTAALIRASGSGLSYVFQKLHASHPYPPMAVSKLSMHENGISGEGQGLSILVGNSEYMSNSGIVIPSNLRNKDTIFCAIDGEVAGMFVLRYNLHSSMLPALGSLFVNKIKPIFVTRDFNLNPRRLRANNRLPMEQVTFPSLQSRIQLSSSNQTHGNTIIAVLCREGLAPFSHAIIAARRIGRAADISSICIRINAVIGVLLSALLTSAGALASLSAWNLSIFLLLWLVPVLLCSFWSTLDIS